MRILKHVNCIMAIIAGEMINIERSKYMYENGRLLPEDQWIDGYPRVTTGAITDTLKSTRGTIYISNDMIIADVVSELKAALSNLDPPPAPSEYYLVESTMFTSTMARPTQEFLRGPNLRVFGGESAVVKYQWDVEHISAHAPVARNNISSAVCNMIASIYYDRDNDCRHAHNTVIFKFSASDMRAPHIDTSNIRIFKHTQWSLAPTFTPNLGMRAHRVTALCNFADGDVYRISYEELLATPAHVAPANTTHCNNCNGVLWGDAYAIAYRRGDYICMCALCAHMGIMPSHADIARFYRVTFPQTLDDMIERAAFDPETADVIREISKRVVTVNHTHDNGDITKLYLIGDKYASCDFNRYVYSGVHRNPVFVERMMCRIRFVK